MEPDVILNLQSNQSKSASWGRPLYTFKIIPMPSSNSIRDLLLRRHRLLSLLMVLYFATRFISNADIAHTKKPLLVDWINSPVCDSKPMKLQVVKFKLRHQRYIPTSILSLYNENKQKVE